MCCLFAASSAYAHEPVNREIADISEALERGGPVVDLLVVRARLWLLDGAPDMALSDLAMAESLQPDNSLIPVLRAHALHRVGREEEALAVLERARPTFASRMLQGLLNEQAGRLSAALTGYAAASRIATTVDSTLAHGRCLQSLGRAHEAASVYRADLDVLHGSTIVRRELIAVLAQLRRFREARAEIDRARNHAQNTTLWDLRDARVLEQMGRARDAESLRQRVLTRLEERIHRRPTAARWLQHAETLRDLGRIESAQASALRALNLSPRYAPALAFAESVGL